jgi:hypothetical protein
MNSGKSRVLGAKLLKTQLTVARDDRLITNFCGVSYANLSAEGVSARSGRPIRDRRARLDRVGYKPALTYGRRIRDPRHRFNVVKGVRSIRYAPSIRVRRPAEILKSYGAILNRPMHNRRRRVNSPSGTRSSNLNRAFGDQGSETDPTHGHHMAAPPTRARRRMTGEQSTLVWLRNPERRVLLHRTRIVAKIGKYLITSGEDNGVDLHGEVRVGDGETAPASNWRVLGRRSRLLAPQTTSRWPAQVPDLTQGSGNGEGAATVETPPQGIGGRWSINQRLRPARPPTSTPSSFTPSPVMDPGAPSAPQVS